ncbi:MAG: FAD-dependent oxidoreductase [Chloroflexi bacterium]|nr:FAD-dependent oxidoreductase [Chloroflexota bacterium]
MPKPVILAVDDDPAVRSAIERDLRQHYAKDYRIVSAGSGSEAITIVHRLKQRSEQVALFLVDQRMPQMEGTAFLAEAGPFYPDARKVLLTGYADTNAAIDSINKIGLDYYLMKPWDPPDQQLYPILDDLLSDWLATVPVPYDGIRVVGTLWSPRSHDIKDFLSRNRIPYLWLDVERDAEAAALVESMADDQASIPLVFFPDGAFLSNPEHRDIAEIIGLQTQAREPFYDLIIIGGGPAGLGAAVYGASEGLRTAMIEKEATGGQAGTSSRIENYLGFPKGLSGADLAQRATTQAIRFGTEILTTQEAKSVRVDGPYRIVTLSDGTELSCHALIVATGVTVKRLDIESASRLSGAGVYYGAALTEAAHYRGQHVCIVGGANSAGQGALFFSKFASEVTMLVRGSSLERGMSQYLVDQIRATPNIRVLLRTTIAEMEGSQKLDAITITDVGSGEISRLPCSAVFLFIGAEPHSEVVAGVVERNAAGFILTGQDLIREGKRPRGWTLQRDPYYLETSVPGIFAVGDVRQGAVRRVASAVGEGAIAVGLVHQYLKSV